MIANVCEGKNESDGLIFPHRFTGLDHHLHILETIKDCPNLLPEVVHVIFKTNCVISQKLWVRTKFVQEGLTIRSIRM